MARILIIDDEAAIRDNLAQLLRLEGHETHQAADGIAGLDAARRLRPDVVFCDILMPGIDGYGVLAGMRATPELAATPFLFLTASANQDARAQALKRGADDYLVKPFRIADVLDAIARQLDRTGNNRGKT
ncbi:MAG: response regulator [Burkholderiales bacterium]|nr:response regulator [Burkholderiales bacterium]